MTAWAEREAYRINKSRMLLQPALPAVAGVWADVGCGDGVFTSALHTLLPPGHEIYAVDKNRRSLKALTRNFAESYPSAVIHPTHTDFTRPLSLPPLDGLLMANSLHFVKKKEPVLARLTSLLKEKGRLIIVEYNASRGNYAVPYPLDEIAFLKLALSAGLSEARIVARIPSSFLGEMYTGLAFVKKDLS